jgi:hypothetical protein
VHFDRAGRRGLACQGVSTGGQLWNERLNQWRIEQWQIAWWSILRNWKFRQLKWWLGSDVWFNKQLKWEHDVEREQQLERKHRHTESKRHPQRNSERIERHAAIDACLRNVCPPHPRVQANTNVRMSHQRLRAWQA